MHCLADIFLVLLSGIAKGLEGGQEFNRSFFVPAQFDQDVASVFVQVGEKGCVRLAGLCDDLDAPIRCGEGAGELSCPRAR